MTVLPCPPVAEKLVHEIVAEVKAHAEAGTLTPEVLALGVMAMQDFVQYLEVLETAELKISEAGTAIDGVADSITEGIYSYGDK